MNWNEHIETVLQIRKLENYLVQFKYKLFRFGLDETGDGAASLE